jgi:hypothetical protein
MHAHIVIAALVALVIPVKADYYANFFDGECLSRTPQG